MEESPQISQKMAHGRISLLNVAAFFVVIVLLAFLGFYKYREYLVNRQIAAVSTQINQTQEEIKRLKAKNLSEVFVAYQTVEELEKKTFLWSKFIILVQTITPKAVFYRTFGVSDAGKVSIAALAPSFQGVAELIRIFQGQSDFDNVFIPSLSRGKDQNQQEIVSFNMVMDYTQDLQQEKKTRAQEENEVSSEDMTKSEDSNVKTQPQQESKEQEEQTDNASNNQPQGQ